VSHPIPSPKPALVNTHLEKVHDPILRKVLNDSLFKYAFVREAWRHRGRVLCVAASSTLNVFASGSSVGEIKLWSVQGILLRDLRFDGFSSISCLQFVGIEQVSFSFLFSFFFAFILIRFAKLYMEYFSFESR
jgi:WD40 repeat protein